MIAGQAKARHFLPGPARRAGRRCRERARQIPQCIDFHRLFVRNSAGPALANLFLAVVRPLRCRLADCRSGPNRVAPAAPRAVAGARPRERAVRRVRRDARYAAGRRAAPRTARACRPSCTARAGSRRRTEGTNAIARRARSRFRAATHSGPGKARGCPNHAAGQNGQLSEPAGAATRLADGEAAQTEAVAQVAVALDAVVVEAVPARSRGRQRNAACRRERDAGCCPGR